MLKHISKGESGTGCTNRLESVLSNPLQYVVGWIKPVQTGLYDLFQNSSCKCAGRIFFLLFSSREIGLQNSSNTSDENLEAAMFILGFGICSIESSPGTKLRRAQNYSELKTNTSFWSHGFVTLHRYVRALWERSYKPI